MTSVQLLKQNIFQNWSKKHKLRYTSTTATHQFLYKLWIWKWNVTLWVFFFVSLSDLPQFISSHTTDLPPRCVSNLIMSYISNVVLKCHFSSLFVTTLTSSHNVSRFNTKQSTHKYKNALDRNWTLIRKKEKQETKIENRKKEKTPNQKHFSPCTFNWP